MHETNSARIASAVIASLTPTISPVGAAPNRTKKRASYGVKYLTEEELSRFFAAVNASGSVRNVAVFRVMLHRGLRVSEVGLLRMEDFRPRDGVLHVHRLKRGKSLDSSSF